MKLCNTKGQRTQEFGAIQKGREQLESERQKDNTRSKRKRRLHKTGQCQRQKGEHTQRVDKTGKAI